MKTKYCACLLSVLLFIGASAPQIAHGRDGTLEQSFFRKGWAQFLDTTDGLEYRDQNLFDSAVDSAGRVIAVGNFRDPVGNNVDCRVLISTPNNQDLEHFRAIALDRGGDNVDFCSSVEVQNDDTLLVGGLASTAGNRFTGFVTRLNLDGTLDNNFFDNGVFEVNAQIPWIDAADTTTLVNATRDAQGRTLFVGRISTPAGLSRGLVLRFNTDGSLDTSFGFDGAVPLADFNPPRVSTSQITVTPAGLIYLAGSTDNPGLPRQTVIFRLLDTGEFDLSYGTGMNGVSGNGGGGRGFTGRCDRVGGIAVDGNDQVIMGCEPDASGATPGPIRAPGVLRLTSSGQPDSSFGNQGLVELIGFSDPIGTIQSPPRIAYSPDTGRITVAATLNVADQAGNPNDWYVTRLQPNGAFDSGFGHSPGRTRLRMDDPRGPTPDPFAERLNNLTLDGRGRPILVGSRTQSDGRTRFLIARLGLADPNVVSGYLDPDFQTTGYDIDPIFDVTGPRLDTVSRAVSINAAGKITTIGRVTLDTNPAPTFRCTVLRKLANGNADNSFDGDGRRTLSLDPAARDGTLCVDVLSLDDDSALIVGSSTDSGTVIRLLANGQVDSNFFGNGVLETWTDLNFQSLNRRVFFKSIHRDTSGRILIAGDTIESNGGITENFGIVLRLLPDLSLDPSFGTQGVARLATSTNPRRLVMSSVRTDNRGFIYVLAYEGSNNDGNVGPAVYRLQEDGSADASYPGGGYLRLRSSCNLGPGLQSGAAALDAEGKLSIVCYRTNASGILRLLANGQTDINYGDGGFSAVRFLNIGNPNGLTLGLQHIFSLPEGKLLVVGGHRNTQASVVDRYGTENIGVQRLLSNGSPDGSFGDPSSGANLFRLPIDYGLFRLTAEGAALQNDGRVLIVGIRVDERPGVPTANRATQLTLRVGNMLPAPLPEEFLRDGFE